MAMPVSRSFQSYAGKFISPGVGFTVNIHNSYKQLLNRYSVVDSKEDHVSMGTIAARQAREILDNVCNVLAIEMLAAAQGIDFLAPLTPGKGTGKAHQTIRNVVPHLDEDRIPAPDINSIRALLTSGRLVQEVEEVVGVLRIY